MTPSKLTQACDPKPVLNKEWDKLSHLDWHSSDTSKQMYQTMLTINQEITLCVEAGGNPNNPSLVLIMGLGSQLIFWTEDFIKRLIDAGFFVIRFDNRDIGLSSKVIKNDVANINIYKMMLRLALGLSNSHASVPYKLFDMVEDTAALIQKLGLKKAHILGVSMGGMIAQILAARYPHLVDHLILMFTSNNRRFLPPPKPNQFKMLFSKPARDEEAEIVAHGVHFINIVGSAGFLNQHQVEKISRLRYIRHYYPLGAKRQFKAIITTGCIQDYSESITAPTLVMHGSEDRLLPPSHGRAVAATIKNAKFIEIKGMAHDIPAYFQPFIVNQMVGFIRPNQSKHA